MATTDSLSEGFRRDGAAPDLLSPSPWHKSAPKTVRKAATAGKSDGWAPWLKHLAKRKKPAPLSRPLPGDASSLLWGVSSGADRPQLPDWLVRPDRPPKNGRPDPSLEKEVLHWLGETAGGGPEVRYALEAVGWAGGLPRLAACVSSEVWWELLGHLVATAVEAAEIPLEENSLVHQLLAGELGATLAHQLPEITPCRNLARRARRALSAGLVDLTDGRGLLQARHLALLRPLLACWTRCRALAAASGRKCWSAAAENQYRWLVRGALRLARPDGSQVFSPPSPEAAGTDLLKAALRLGGNKDDGRIAGLVLGGKNRRAGKRPSKPALPDPAVHSEWAATAVLRRAWSRPSERLTVTYPGQEVRVELGAGRDVFFSGTWQLDVRLDGRPVAPTTDWEEVCWASDADADYLELQIDLVGGLSVQRHLLLARDDRFLLLADSIMGPRHGRLQYCGRLPLCPGVGFEPAAETREGFLAAGKRRALVMPLALPEWRVQRRVGHLVETESGLELVQAAEGRGLMAPLLFDLAPKRVARPLTWRQLTVAESLRPVADDVAVGYRVAIGRAQWLIYRSLAPRAPRTVLGQHLSTELLVARFRRSGETDPLVELE